MNADMLKECIDNEFENEHLDFKIKPYNWKDEGSKCDYLTDVLSFANANIEGDKYIILGVKPKNDGTRDYRGVLTDEMEDSAEYQQLVSENIEPSISIESKTIQHKGKDFGIIRIFNCNNKPYLMKKKYGRLEQGFTKIRRGSRNCNLTRYFLDDIYELKHSKVRSDFKIFGLEQGNLSSSIKFKKFDFFPNMVNKRDEIIQLLNEINNYNLDDYIQTIESYKEDEEEVSVLSRLKFPSKNVVIEEETKNIICSFAETTSIKLNDNFFDIGNVTQNFNGLNCDGLSIYSEYKTDGSDKSIKKYNMILELGERLEKSISWLKFIAETKNFNYLELAIKEVGNTDDEEIEVNLEIPKDKYIDTELFPQPNSNIISEINECYSECMFKPNYGDEISDFRKMVFSVAYSSPPTNFLPLYGNDIEIMDGLYDYIDYNVETSKNKTVLNFTIKNIKENETMIFPGNILINGNLDQIKYNIVSKKCKEKISGIIKIDNNEEKNIDNKTIN